MEYPDEEKDPIGVREVGMSESEIMAGFGPVDVEDKLGVMLGAPLNKEEIIKPTTIDNDTLFTRGDRLVEGLPTINAEDKIKQILDF